VPRRAGLRDGDQGSQPGAALGPDPLGRPAEAVEVLRQNAARLGDVAQPQPLGVGAVDGRGNHDDYSFGVLMDARPAHQQPLTADSPRGHDGRRGQSGQSSDA
jgi:hypothetical protein